MGSVVGELKDKAVAVPPVCAADVLFGSQRHLFNPLCPHALQVYTLQLLYAGADISEQLVSACQAPSR